LGDAAIRRHFAVQDSAEFFRFKGEHARQRLDADAARRQLILERLHPESLRHNRKGVLNAKAASIADIEPRR
jgi:hypothetical protein